MAVGGASRARKAPVPAELESPCPCGAKTGVCAGLWGCSLRTHVPQQPENAPLFKHGALGLCRCHRVKVRSFWFKVGPTSCHQ